MRGMLWICLFFFIPISFANQNVLLQHIERLEHPASKQGFFKTHQLLFFFASTCPHCHQAAPSLKYWADAHEMHVMAVSFDHQVLPEFPRVVEASQALTRAAFAKRPVTFPALFIINMQTHQLYPAMLGEWTLSELETRMNVLIEKIEHYEGEQR